MGNGYSIILPGQKLLGKPLTFFNFQHEVDLSGKNSGKTHYVKLDQTDESSGSTSRKRNQTIGTYSETEKRGKQNTGDASTRQYKRPYFFIGD